MESCRSFPGRQVRECFGRIKKECHAARVLRVHFGFADDAEAAEQYFSLAPDRKDLEIAFDTGGDLDLLQDEIGGPLLSNCGCDCRQ